MDIEPSYIYKTNWRVWPNTQITKDLDQAKCMDSVDGYCVKDLSLEECIDRTETYGKESGAGWYIEIPEINETICNSIDAFGNDSGALSGNWINPLYQLQNQNILRDDINITSFFDRRLFPFPPDQANIVFYSEPLKLIVDDKIAPIFSEDKEYNKNISSTLIFYPNYTTDRHFNNFIPIKFGYTVVISLLGTSLIARNKNGVLKWRRTSGNFDEESFNFLIIPQSPDQKKGDYLKLNDKFLLLYKDNFVVYNPMNDQLELQYINIDQVRNNSNAIFSIRSDKKVYYCDNNVCKDIDVYDTQPIEDGRRYNGNMVYKREDCFGVCNNEVK